MCGQFYMSRFRTTRVTRRSYCQQTGKLVHKSRAQRRSTVSNLKVLVRTRGDLQQRQMHVAALRRTYQMEGPGIGQKLIREGR